MADNGLSGMGEVENRQKPFRSRSFSFGTQRKPGSDMSNTLLNVVSTYPRKPATYEAQEKKPLFGFTKRTKQVKKSTVKYREMRHGFLHSRNACRYICNILRFIGMLLSFFASGLHLNYQWHMGNYSFEIIIPATVAATSFLFVVVLYWFFKLKDFSRCIVHFWTSLAYGIIFLQPTNRPLLNKTIMVSVVLSTSIRCICSFAERLFKLSIPKSQFLSQSEVCDFVSFALSCGLLPIHKAIDMWLEVLALAFFVMNARMKAPLTTPLLVLYGIISAISVIGNMNMVLNKYIFALFVVRMVWDPCLDVYFSKLQPLVRWGCFFRLSRAVVFPFMAILLTLDLVFCAYALQAITLHAKYEWPIVIPFIAISGICWFILHMTYFALHISFLMKLARCRELAKSHCASYNKFLHIMSREGLRSLSQICHGVASGATFTTALFGVVCWRREVGTYPIFFLLLLITESLSLTLFSHLSTRLRGTACGIGIVTSTSAGSYFSEHWVESFGEGCVGWNASSKMTSALIEKKLESLFSKESQSQKRAYDSYILFYSGAADRDGSWILEDRNKLSFERLIEIWNDKAGKKRRNQTHSRLLIVSDAPNSNKWLNKAQQETDTPVAVQTCLYACDSADPQAISTSSIEEGSAKRGDFIQLWTAFMTALQNSNHPGEEHSGTLTRDFISDIQGQGMKTQYAFSNAFLYRTLSPPGGDFYAHPCTFCCLPVIIALAFLSIRFFSVFSCSVVSRCYNRCRYRLFKRKLWDLGGGVVLVNS